MRPIQLKIQNCYEQTGVADHPLVMWKYEQGQHRQTAYRIDLLHGETLVYSSGKVLSDEQNGICLPVKLAEHARYSMTVTVWDENDQAETSQPAKFLAGVRQWKGHWIGNGTAKPFLARKRLHCTEGQQVVLSLAVGGQFELRLNGRRVTQHAYQGSQTDYNKHLLYFTCDLSPHLQAGENELTVEVGNGWYLGDDDGGKRYFYTMNQGYHPYGSCLALLAQLTVDGQTLVSDQSWQVSASQTVLANIYGNEDIDATRPLEWSDAVLLDADAPKGALVPFCAPPVTHKRCYTPVSFDAQRMIFDFGQNMAAQFCIRLKGERGQIVRLIPAEKLAADGDIEQTVDVYSQLTLSGQEDVFEQKFSVHGARWYQVQGATPEQILDFQLFATTSAAADCGSFRSSDARLDRIRQIILHAIESNLNHSHTDCPTIEKLGWLEPNHLMARSIFYNKQVDTLWDKIAMDIRDAQYTAHEFDVDRGVMPYEYKEGLIPSIAPRYARFIRDMGQGSFWDIIPWGSSILLAAREQYRMYGNKQVLQQNYQAAKRYLAYLGEQYRDYPRIFGDDSGNHFIRTGLGDWGIEQNKGESRENIETAFYYHDLTCMAEISAILGKGEEQEYLERAQQVKRAYNQALLGEHNGKKCYLQYRTGRLTQTNQAIPLAFGLVPEEARADVRETMVSLCSSHLRCGEIGLVYLLRELCKAGQNDRIYEMILQPSHPSYLRFVEMGETTLPEFWRDDARSRNHDMMGHIMEWLFEGIAGIHTEDAFKTVTIAPAPPSKLEEFFCEYDSIRGKITVSLQQGKFTVAVPNNCCCKEILPQSQPE